MSKSAVLRALVTQRLTEAAEDILVLFERSIAEYEQEVLVLTQTIGSQQQRPSSQPSLDTTADITILSVRQDSAPIKEEPPEQLEEPTFAPVFLKTEHDEDQLSLHCPIPTEESREENDGSDLEEEAAPLSPQEPNSEEDSDSSETDDSDDYVQEEVPAKRRNRMSSSESSSSEHIPFSCLECGETIHDKKKVEEHMRTHAGGQNYRCIICDERFCTIPALTRHKRKVHFICPHCTSRFETKTQMRWHLTVHTRERKMKSFRCLNRGKRFVREKMLINHPKHHTEFEPFQCSVCTQTFPTQRQRSKHMKLHMGNRPIVCDVCHRNFPAKHRLTEHMKKHNEEDRPFSCPACGKSFVEQMDLTIHLKLIHHICPVCSKGFQNKSSLMSHLSDHTEAQLREVMNPYSCSDCGKRFSRDSALQKHRVIHSEDNPFKCTVCEKGFLNESSLVKHRETHQLECSECGIKLDSKISVDIHRTRVHKICVVCNKSFNDGDRLKTHLKTHKGVCPECGFCGKKTSIALHLSRVHFICPVCEKNFVDKVHIKEHLKIHVKDGTLDLSSAQIGHCGECGELFFIKSELWAHLEKTGHKEDFD